MAPFENNFDAADDFATDPVQFPGQPAASGEATEAPDDEDGPEDPDPEMDAPEDDYEGFEDPEPDEAPEDESEGFEDPEPDPAEAAPAAPPAPAEAAPARGSEHGERWHPDMSPGRLPPAARPIRQGV